ncbi:hypothetical protein SAMN05216223_116131 [Actinacidiphila yanglinensis]|uniref:Uncharacterized protein n=1 Tax=Actinacidiphila yanglinensis TaxID=310779 RepID=A0A1H6DKU1_9ACTN|nr:hypothetical protein SAMN05216223_116131 [Actinacidiphila yanglinensis]
MTHRNLQPRLPRASSPARGVRFICGRRALVSSALTATALDLARTEDAHTYSAEDVFDTLVCTIDHRGPIHYGAVLNLRGTHAGTIWTLWRDGIEAHNAIVLPDCPATNGDHACSEFSGHPGAHSWNLATPPRPTPTFPLPIPPSPHHDNHVTNRNPAP